MVRRHVGGRPAVRGGRVAAGPERAAVNTRPLALVMFVLGLAAALLPVMLIVLARRQARTEVDADALGDTPSSGAADHHESADASDPRESRGPNAAG